MVELRIHELTGKSSSKNSVLFEANRETKSMNPVGLGVEIRHGPVKPEQLK